MSISGLDDLYVKVNLGLSFIKDNIYFFLLLVLPVCLAPVSVITGNLFLKATKIEDEICLLIMAQMYVYFWTNPQSECGFVHFA